MRIAVFKVNKLGDNVVFLPVVQTLTKLLPQARIRVYTEPLPKPLYEGYGRLETFAFPRSNPIGTFWRALGDVRRFAPDICLNSYDSPSLVNALNNLSGAKQRIGHESPLQRIKTNLTCRIPLDRTRPVIDLHWELLLTCLKQLELPQNEIPPKAPPPDLRHLLGGDMERVPGRIVIHPGASSAVRQWFPERYKALLNSLREREDLHVYWIDREMDVDVPRPIEKVRPTTLRDFCRLLASASLYIGHNTGPMHLASALGTPSLIFSGPSQRVWDPAWNREKMRVLRHPELWCLPCESPGNVAMNCKNTEAPMACMKYWDVPTVLRMVDEMLLDAPPVNSGNKAQSLTGKRAGGT